MHAPCSASARILSSRLSALWLYFTFFASFLYSVLKVRLSAAVAAAGGDEQNRTVDPLLARQVLSQLSYTPTFVDTAIGQENKQREKSPTTIREFLTLDVLFSQRLSIERR